MRKRSFRPALESLDLRIAPSGTGGTDAPAGSAGAPADTSSTDVQVISQLTGLPAVCYGGDSGEPVSSLTGLPASCYN